MSRVVDRLERHQVAIYLIAIAVGAAAGWAAGSSAAADLGSILEHAINPLLGALLYVTFLQVPVAELGKALRDTRFLSALLVTNFVAVPLVVAVMFTMLPPQQAVQIGVLLVLLCPCVDYVIVFSGLAGGSSTRLIAATPLLLVVQMALLPVFLWLFLGSELADIVEFRPFVVAFVVLIVIPLVLAWATQWWATRTPSGARVTETVNATMVPLMAAVLFVVVASQIPALDGNLADVVSVVPFFVAFLVVMALVGTALAAAFRLDTGGRRALVFSGATRNSLVVLPLALALPAGFEIAAVVVVTQTLVEVIGMVVYVRLIPRLVT